MLYTLQGFGVADHQDSSVNKQALAVADHILNHILIEIDKHITDLDQMKFFPERSILKFEIELAEKYIGFNCIIEAVVILSITVKKVFKQRGIIFADRFQGFIGIDGPGSLAENLL
jgi:CRISPR/Cas system CMR-associated protein Cmr5 small subunit